MIHCIITVHIPVVSLGLVNLSLGHSLSGRQFIRLVSCDKPGSWTSCILWSPAHCSDSPHQSGCFLSCPLFTTSPQSLQTTILSGNSSSLLPPLFPTDLSFVTVHHPFIPLGPPGLCFVPHPLTHCPFLMSHFSVVDDSNIPFDSHHSSFCLLPKDNGSFTPNSHQ